MRKSMRKNLGKAVRILGAAAAGALAQQSAIAGTSTIPGKQ